MILDFFCTAGRIFVIVAKFLKFEKNMPHVCCGGVEAETAIDKATSPEDCQAKEPTKN